MEMQQTHQPGLLTAATFSQDGILLTVGGVAILTLFWYMRGRIGLPGSNITDDLDTIYSNVDWRAYGPIKTDIYVLRDLVVEHEVMCRRLGRDIAGHMHTEHVSALHANVSESIVNILRLKTKIYADINTLHGGSADPVNPGYVELFDHFRTFMIEKIDHLPLFQDADTVNRVVIEFGVRYMDYMSSAASAGGMC